MTEQDRRESVRINKRNLFFFTMHDNGADSQHYQQGLLLDYSLAGIRFITNEQLDKNSALLIELDLDDFSDDPVQWREAWETGEDESLKVIGSVMWCSVRDRENGVYEVGTRFLEKASE